MSALVTLGLRLARAGGALRAWSIAVGNAVGILLLLAALALPVALFPDPVERAAERPSLLAVLTFLLVPGGVLLVMVGRLSSGVRDQRLASLRMIGLPPRHTRVVAAVENGFLALCGAVAGAAVFLAVVQPVSGVVADSDGVLAQGFDVGALQVVVAVVGVVALSVVVGTASTWDRALPGAARAEARPRTPGAWRLLVLAAGVGALAWLASTDVGTTDDGLETVLMLGGSLLTGVGIALVTPLVVSWVAAALVRSDAVTPRLAGRAIQADSASASRVVAGLGVAVFLATGALGVLGAFEAAPQYATALRSFGPGPQRLFLATVDDSRTSDGGPMRDADLAAVLEIPGVRGVAPTTLLADCDADQNCLEVLVGTCAQVEVAFEISGCDDTRASVIVTDDTGMPHLGFSAPAPGDSVHLVLDPEVREVAQTVLLDGPPLTQHLRAQVEAWSWPSYAVAFVPASMLGDWYTPPTNVEVVADGGNVTRQRLIDWADARGGLYAFQPYDTDYKAIMNIRAAVWTLCGIAVAVALVVLALGAADRANERRRSVARQVMAGVPGRVLRRSQLLQVLLPVVVAVGLALAAGAVGVRGYANLAESGTLLDGRGWAALVATAATGGLLAALSTVPLARTRITPELLRRE
ncbi:FtsX-like permease family protein [Xylanimonas protaetiae]|uniref:FtsX-like permease family protein n=1 Tax=Xylanimonas protaetiae TaxID=2509457 RepID=A0A4P6F563_9MICO|nr:FtsX-like permease family protein [Xylanimonas protaetiae]QAY70496.1 FtsX-like permease family protein [Xylanimonas protaetiae]